MILEDMEPMNESYSNWNFLIGVSGRTETHLDPVFRRQVIFEIIFAKKKGQKVTSANWKSGLKLSRNPSV